MQFIANALKNLQLSWRSDFGNLSQLESMVFLAIASRPGIESSKIQEDLNLDQPHASRILKKLIGKRIIRPVILKRGDRKKAYFLEPQQGAVRFLSWIDGVLDELLIRNPAMLGRFVAALEDAPPSVLEGLAKGVAQVQKARALRDKSHQAKNGYNLSRRNRTDYAYRKLFIDALR
jgi:hypothetical protein